MPLHLYHPRHKHYPFTSIAPHKVSSQHHPPIDLNSFISFYIEQLINLSGLASLSGEVEHVLRFFIFKGLLGLQVALATSTCSQVEINLNLLAAHLQLVVLSHVIDGGGWLLHRCLLVVLHLLALAEAHACTEEHLFEQVRLVLVQALGEQLSRVLLLLAPFGLHRYSPRVGHGQRSNVSGNRLGQRGHVT